MGAYIVEKTNYKYQMNISLEKEIFFEKLTKE